MKKLLVLIGVMAIAAGCATNITQDISRGDAEVAIRRANPGFVTAARNGDAGAMAAYYTDDAVMMAPNVPAMRGRDGVRQFWSGFLAAGRVEVTLTTDEVVQSGDLATEVGHYDVTITPATGAAIRDSGKYVNTWRKTNGRWFIAYDIFNSDRPAPR